MVVSMLIIWICGMCHMESLYVIVRQVLCVTWGGCMWSWGRFCASHGEVVCDHGGGSVCHMGRLYVIVGEVLCVTWRGCMWLWGRFCVSHGEVVCDRGGGSACVWCSRSMGNLCSTLQFLWTLKCSEKNAVLKEKKENQGKKKKPSDTFHAHELSHLMLDGFTCESLSSEPNLF